MAARMATTDQGTLPTRVSVLEHGVQELRTGLDGHRNETRAGFQSLQATLERVGTEVANRARPTNWSGIIGAVASTIMIVGAIFGLAEWRVSNAVAPINEFRIERGVILRAMAEELVQLRIKLAVLEVGERRVRVEEEARIGARVNAEQRARELVNQPPIIQAHPAPAPPPLR